jgi:2-amino-4-hydroxy-6-hydroxymethyldihydropteridine diphosphokinase
MIYKYYIGLGSNIEPRLQFLQKAFEELNKIGKTTRKSAIYETSPWGEYDQSNFLNAIIRFYSEQNPFDLLKSIKAIERKMGRNHQNKKWSEREIDLDILFADNIFINKDFLKLPHQHFKERNFVLIPMAELAVNYKPENHNHNINHYLNNCFDNSIVQLSIRNW